MRDKPTMYFSQGLFCKSDNWERNQPKAEIISDKGGRKTYICNDTADKALDRENTLQITNMGE